MPQTQPIERVEGEARNQVVASNDLNGDLIWVDPERMSGMPCFAGTRVPIRNLWDYLESGEPLSEFLEGFEGISREQAVGVLEMALKRLLENV